MRILGTSIKTVRQYIGKDCTLSYDENIIKIQIGRVTLELNDIQSVVHKRTENILTIFSDYGNIEIDNKN